MARHKLLAGAALVASGMLVPHATGNEGKRVWSLGDQLAVPEVRALAIAADGKSAAYVVRIADRESDRTVAILRRVDLANGETRELLRARWIDQLNRIPDTSDWSARIDVGAGVQLYRIGANGETHPIVVHPATAIFGDSEGAVFPGYGHAPLRTGVRAHSWSPDGQRLFYVTVDAELKGKAIRYDGEVTSERARRRSPGQARASIYLREPDGTDTLLATRPQSDLTTFFDRNHVRWEKDEVRYDVMEIGSGGQQKVVTMAWAFADRKARVLDPKVERVYWLLPGPRGGRLSSQGNGDSRDLVETLPGGKTHNYGRFAFAVGDGRAVGGFRSQDGQRAIAGTRMIDDPRFGLAVIEKDRVHTIDTEHSLSHCDFVPTLDHGACIAQGHTTPPAVVAVDVPRGAVERVASVSPLHDGIDPLKIEPRTWVNRHGYKATGYVVWPRGYEKGKRYPAIVVTHGTDGDDRFANRENQWEYPVQLFAERGYFVLLVNDPSSRQNAEIRAAYDAWINETQDLPPETLRQLIWLNGVASYEDAVKELVDAGVIDPARVGIAGYSRGSQMVNVAMTNSHVFRAASSGDGGYLEPALYADVAGSYDAVFGGPPTDPAALVHYRRLSPSLRAGEVCGAILQQVAAPYVPSIDFHAALRKAGVPAQLSLYPGEDAASDETHIFHIPSNRIGAMQENIAWFDYWLLGKRDPGSPFADRYPLWDKMGAAAPRCDAKGKEPDG
ncbi:prolyl oligopeptidase family serine peptidase [Sphingopyxis sp.]|jgi:dipeptidyl aminopeptidase/acylaminoacyl peptidase|uniref:prolyl oligopeptidase family serine peptidase n=1 Tax=Sphingopyxis sp. TaxID=1908224 RepID=UPI002E084B00|nr:prolyl oligopeptidase family serine peptidase [Sphingopyxis sp.]